MQPSMHGRMKPKAFDALALLAALILAFGGAILTASPASAAPAASVTPSATAPNCPPIFGDGDLPCSIAEAHHCKSLGTYRDNEAVICVDLIVGKAGSSNLEVNLQISAYCQSLKGLGLVQCADVTVYGGTYDPTTTDKSWHWAKRCGHGNPSDCAKSGKNYFSHDEVIIPPGSQVEVWGVAWDGSQIELPGDDYVELIGNLNTTHFVVKN